MEEIFMPIANGEKKQTQKDKVFKLHSNWSMETSTDCGKLWIKNVILGEITKNFIWRDILKNIYINQNEVL